jgi:hypothetical protein
MSLSECDHVCKPARELRACETIAFEHRGADFKMTAGRYVVPRDPAPIEIDTRPCGLCGLTIDRHQRVDTQEGPKFFCLPPDEMSLEELERRVELIRQVEVAAAVREMELNDPRDRWKYTGEAPPPEIVCNSAIGIPTAIAKQPYRTPQSTIDAFWYVVRLTDPERLAAWLDDHPKDESFLLNLLERK